MHIICLNSSHHYKAIKFANLRHNMVIVEQLEEFPEIKNSIVTSGTFDGVHYGHKKILTKVVDAAKSCNGKSVVLTFWPHPRFILSPQNDSLKLLSSFEEKASEFEAIGIDYLVKVEFTKAFSEISSEDFIENVLVKKLKTKKLIIGYDHRFGKNREGGFDYLMEHCNRFGFEVEEITRQDIDDVVVSSTKIRNALLAGDVDKAKEYLSHAYEIHGKVVKGHKIGASIGFPTANVSILQTFKLIPKDGVYAVQVIVGEETHMGMLNIGDRPTINGSGRAMEVHIFDFDRNIYNDNILIRFIRRLRDEEKFVDLDALKNQLQIDKQTALNVLSNTDV